MEILNRHFLGGFLNNDNILVNILTYLLFLNFYIMLLFFFDFKLRCFWGIVVQMYCLGVSFIPILTVSDINN